MLADAAPELAAVGSRGPRPRALRYGDADRRERDRVLYGLSAKRPRLHRYTWWRIAVGVVFTLAIAALSAFDVMRFDFWRGRHVYLGRELGLVEAAKAFAFPFLGINVLILLGTRFFGRYLCGFVCPYGSIARLAEWFRFRNRKGTRAQRLGSLVSVGLVCFLLAFITFSFWVDVRVFALGSTRAVLVSTGLLLGLTALMVGVVQLKGLHFCRETCPSGVYFALLSHDTSSGIHFDHPETCIDCDACDRACPMDLGPRAHDSGDLCEGLGFYPEAMTFSSLCIRCGDCVSTCEAVTAKQPGPVPLRMGLDASPADRAAPAS